MSLDTDLLIWLSQDCRNPVFDVLFGWVSERWSFALPLGVLLLVDGLRRGGRVGLLLLLSLALTVGAADFTGNQLKLAFAQARPCVFHHGVGACTDSFKGMPSNHTLNFVTAATFVTLMTQWRQWQIGLWLIALLVGLSRIYLVKHYPSQVLVGGVLGVAFGCTGWAVFHFGLGWPRFADNPKAIQDNAVP